MSINELHEFKQAVSVFLGNNGRKEYRRVVIRFNSLLEKGLVGYDEKCSMLLTASIWIRKTKSKLEDKLRRGGSVINGDYARNIHSNWIAVDDYLKSFNLESPQLPPKVIWGHVRQNVRG